MIIYTKFQRWEGAYLCAYATYIPIHTYLPMYIPIFLQLYTGILFQLQCTPAAFRILDVPTNFRGYAIAASHTYNSQ